MQELLKKKFSIGISLAMEYEDYKKIIDDYEYYIYSVYFSPPLGHKFHSRSIIGKQLEDIKNVQKLEKIIAYCAGRGIVVDADLNVSGLSDEEVNSFIGYVQKNRHINEVTTLAQYGNIIHSKLNDMKLVYSFNNFYNGQQVDNYYSTIVLGRNYLRDIQSMNSLIEAGREIKLLINNGCSLKCETCLRGVENCEKTVKQHLEAKTIDELYAEQTLFPWELYEIITRVKRYDKLFFKISNRTSGYEYLVRCLDAYTNFSYAKPYIDESLYNYSIFCRMQSMRKRFEYLDYETIEKEKTTIWSRIKDGKERS